MYYTSFQKRMPVACHLSLMCAGPACALYYLQSFSPQTKPLLLPKTPTNSHSHLAMSFTALIARRLGNHASVERGRPTVCPGADKGPVAGRAGGRSGRTGGGRGLIPCGNDMCCWVPNQSLL